MPEELLTLDAHVGRKVVFEITEAGHHHVVVFHPYVPVADQNPDAIPKL